MQSKPYFSVIIPTYNRAEALSNNLKQLVNQTFKNFEVVISDDGSVDNTEDVVKSFNNILDISYIKSINSGGPARPRNMGVSVARADWICFLDSDDSWYPKKLEVLKEHIFKFSLLNVVFYHPMLVKHGNKGMYIIGNTVCNQETLYEDLFYTGNKIVLSSICLPKSLFNKINGFQECIALIGVEDYDLYIRLAQLKIKFINLKTILGTYNVGDDNISKNEKKQIFKIRRMLFSYLGTNGNKEKINAEKITSLIRYMFANLLSPQRKARKYYLKVLSSPASSIIKFKSFCKLIKSLSPI
jgi:glycosyltransferase involved in cell wall biosynthesis